MNTDFKDIYLATNCTNMTELRKYFYKKFSANLCSFVAELSFYLCVSVKICVLFNLAEKL